MKNEIKDVLNNYYNSINEDKRLTKDKAHSIEFLTTIKYIEKYLKDKDKILEIGAGTGKYSIYLAKKGFEIDAVELIDKNLEILKNKITQDIKINAIKGNALDLSMYKDNTFNIVLLLGPIYHLFTKQEKEKAIREAIRVTKRNGIIFIAYITNEAMILDCLKKSNISKLKDICDSNNGYKVKETPNNIFSVSYVKDFENMMKSFPVKKLGQVATDGIATNMLTDINKLNDEEFDTWLRYHFANCEREDLLSYSSHVLYICRKK